MIFTFVTPEKKFLVGQEVEELVVPGVAGELNVLPGHAPLVSLLDTGILKWKNKGSSQFNQAVVSRGYCHISAGEVLVLAELAESAEDIDVVAAKANLKKSEDDTLAESITEQQWDDLQKSWAVQRAKIQLGDSTKH